MKPTARFSVDPRLSALLGESYTSSERALRELVDNAWDAEARVVKITLPDTLTGELGLELDILVVGGSVDPKLQSDYSGKRTRFLSYRAVIANARTQLEWLIKQLNEKP